MMQKRILPYLGFLLFTLSLCLQGFAQRPRPVNRPTVKSTTGTEPVNVVIFMADDLGVTDIGPYGNRVVRTPHLDRLAGESLLFSQAFAASPTCSPSRAALQTGMLPFRNGAHANHTIIKEGLRTLPAYLTELGYRAAIAGKYHIGPIQDYPYEMIHGTNTPEPGHEEDGALWTDLNMGPVDDWLGTVEKDEPFVLVVNDHSPHVIWPEDPSYKSDEVDIPSRHIDTKDARVSRTRYYTDITKMDSNVGKLMESLEAHGFDENTVLIFTADQGPQWPFGKWGLYDYGIQVPLLVRWPGVIEGGNETNALVSLVDILPTVIELAGGKAPAAPEEIDGRSLLSLLTGDSTRHREKIFAAHTGDKTMNRSPMRMLRTHRYKYILNLAPEIRYTTHMDKAKDHDGGREYWDSWVAESFRSEHAASVLWRYHNRPKEELYDIKADPDEMHNLVNDPHYAEIIADFREEMAEWRKQQGDKETGPATAQATKNKRGGAPYIFK